MAIDLPTSIIRDNNYYLFNPGLGGWVLIEGPSWDYIIRYTSTPLYAGKQFAWDSVKIDDEGQLTCRTELWDCVRWNPGYVTSAAPALDHPARKKWEQMIVSRSRYGWMMVSCYVNHIGYTELVNNDGLGGNVPNLS